MPGASLPFCLGQCDSRQKREAWNHGSGFFVKSLRRVLGAGGRALETALADRFYVLEVQDRTRLAEDVWARAGEDSLRGLFLGELRRRYEDASTEEERQQITQAVRFGLAALEGRDIG